MLIWFESLVWSAGSNLKNDTSADRVGPCRWDSSWSKTSKAAPRGRFCTHLFSAKGEEHEDETLMQEYIEKFLVHFWWQALAKETGHRSVWFSSDIWIFPHYVHSSNSISFRCFYVPFPQFWSSLFTSEQVKVQNDQRFFFSIFIRMILDNLRLEPSSIQQY